MKNKKSLLIIMNLAGAILSLNSCFSDPEPEPKVEEAVKKTIEETEKTTPVTQKSLDLAVAIPIAPELVEKQPHLTGLEGEILIGNSYFQAVFAGVPISRNESGEYKGITAFFTNENGTWTKSRLWQQMTFKKQWVGGEHFIPIGLNVESSKEKNSAMATIVFAPSGKRQPTIKLNFHVFADQNWLIIENASPKPSSGADNFWEINWTSEFGEQLMLKKTEFQSSASVRFFESEIMSYVGEVNTTGKIALLPKSTIRIYDKEESPKNLLHFFIGAKSNSDVASQAVIHKKCLNSFRVSGGNFAVFKNINLTAYIDCFRKNNTLEKNITLVNSFDKVGRYFAVSENSKKINYFFLPPQAEIKVSSQNQPSFQLENAISTRRTAFATTTGPSRIRTLDIKNGQGRILNPKASEQSGAYLIRLLSHISPNSVEITPKWDLEKQATNLWKGNRWPINFSVEEGYYRVEVFNLSQSKTCSAVIEIKKDIQAETICQFPEAEKAGTFTGNFENFQLLHPLRLDPLDSASESSKNSIQAISKEGKQLFRISPVTSDIQANWNEFQKANPQESRFIALGRFAAQLGAGINREWLCPESKISKKEFTSTIRKIRPNAIQTFACPSLSFSAGEAIEITRQITGNIPIVLPNTRNNPLSPLSGTALLISESGKPQGQIYLDNKVLSQLSNESKYSLSQGSMIKINTPISPEILVKSSGVSENVSFDIEVKALWPYEATSLVIEQSNGKTFRREIKIGAGEYAITKFNATVKDDLKWIQIHLYGRIVSEYSGLHEQSKEELILASSSPFPIRSEISLNN